LNGRARCPWPSNDPLMVAYHDAEWGVPLRNDRRLFEFLVLESMQAGLSWRCVLHKRENFRKAFHGFDPEKVARYGAKDVKRLLSDAGIIRNRMKIEAAIANAKAFLAAKKRHGSFAKYMWGFVGGKPLANRFRSPKELPAKTADSDRISKAMKADGFRFVGSTVIYAHMQATGMVNDHLVGCFRHSACAKAGRA
jgi:DNA-3-methyladenine glycosylase I